jgi:hypothetical protein
MCTTNEAFRIIPEILVIIAPLAAGVCGDTGDSMSDSVIVIGGQDGEAVVQLGAMSNRHGLVAGATGTGKTVTLQVLAEGFSRIGVPVFAADVKGDLSGIGAPANPHPEAERRLGLIPLPGYQRRGYPVAFWDVFGVSGHPCRRRFRNGSADSVESARTQRHAEWRAVRGVSYCR